MTIHEADGAASEPHGCSGSRRPASPGFLLNPLQRPPSGKATAPRSGHVPGKFLAPHTCRAGRPQTPLLLLRVPGGKPH